MCEETCFLVLVLPVRSLIYLAISSFRPAEQKMERGTFRVEIEDKLLEGSFLQAEREETI